MVAAATMTPAALQLVPLANLHESPFNKRRTWGNLPELAESMGGGVGILEPLMGRPHPLQKGHVELVFGHRRLKAAKLAKLDFAPLMLREMSDDQVIEAQAIENLQREDIHPIEEAETFELLCERQHLTAEQLAAKVGKSRSYVYGRLKLLDLCPAGRKAFVEGKILASVALYVARIAKATQPQLLEDLESRGYSGDPVSAREAFRLIESRYMLRLVEAPFDRGDETLLPKAGSCKDCPKRTGNQRELFADVKSADVCTDPPCFEKKKEAHAKRVLAKAKEDGKKVLEGKEAERVLGYGSDYVDLDDRCDAAAPPYDPNTDDEDADPETPTYRELAKGAELPLVVARDRQGKIHELAPKSVLQPIVKKAGVKKDYNLEARRSFGGGGGGGGNGDKERRAAVAKKRASTLAVAGAIVAAAEAKEPGKGFWLMFAKLLADHAGHDEALELLKRRGVPPEKVRGCYDHRSKLRALLKDATDNVARGLAVEIALGQRAYSFGSWGGSTMSAEITTVAKLFKVDAAKIGAKAREELVAAKRAKKATKKKGGGK